MIRYQHTRLSWMNSVGDGVFISILSYLNETVGT